MNNEGYQILEPKILHTLVSNRFGHVSAVAVMSWLCSLLRVDLREHLEHVDFNVICVSYAGSYPAIGIHYKDKNYRDIAPLAEAAIDRILRGKSLAEFARFIDDSNIDWQEVAAKIMSNTV